MATKTIPLTAVSVQQGSPSKAFGQLANIPVSGISNNIQRMLLIGALGQIPSSAVVSLAEVRVYQTNGVWSGSQTVTLQVLTSAFSTKSIWGSNAGTPPSRPNSTTTGQVSVSKTNGAANSQWAFGVTTLVQQFKAGSLPYFGFQLTSAATTAGRFRGSASSTVDLVPVLYVEYLQTGDAATGLAPTGVVGVTKPVLRAQVPGDTIATQWQIDPTGAFTSPTFDSGEVAGAGGYFDLAGSSYGGNTGSTTWRMRYKTALGWQPWSAGVSWSYTGYGSFAWTSPGTTTEDPSSPISGTHTPEAGATATGWRVATLDASGNVLEDSGLRTGSVAFGPTVSYVTARVDLFSSTAREATPGDPGYLRVTRTPTVSPSGTPAAFTSPAAANDGVRPAVNLSGSRSSTPDEVAVYRRKSTDASMGALVLRGPGTTYAPAGVLAWADWSAPMNTDWVYDVYAIVNGAWSAKATTAAVTPACKGVWLYLPDDGSSVALWDKGDTGETRSEQLNVFQTVTGQSFVRRIAGGAKTGEFSGFSFLDALGSLGQASKANWLAWQQLGVDTTYRFVVGNLNLAVNLWNLDTRQRAENGPGQFIEDAVGNWLAVS